MIVKAYFDGEFHSVASLQKYIGKYGAFGPLVLMTFQAMQVIIPVLPGFMGCGMGSVMFGVGTGFLSGSLFWEKPWCTLAYCLGFSFIRQEFSSTDDSVMFISSWNVKRETSGVWILSSKHFKSIRE